MISSSASTLITSNPRSARHSSSRRLACRAATCRLWVQRSVDRQCQATRGHSPAKDLYKKTANPRARQQLLGHTKLESTVRYLAVEVDDALKLSEGLEL